MSVAEKPKLKIKDLESPGLSLTTWCPGCGDYGILQAVKMAMVQLNLHPHEVMIVSGIGCGSKLPDYIRANGFNSLHGRPVPIAQGIKVAAHDMKVLITDGDGDNYGIGAGHWVHVMRRNPDITHIVEDNQVYGLTKGQYAPTAPFGFIGTTTPEGSIEFAVNPVAWAITIGATFVARGFSGDVKHLSSLIAKGIEHKGYALIDVLQPCVIYDPLRDTKYDWYRERCYKLEEDPTFDPHDKVEAWKRAHEWGERIPIGIFYIEEGRPTQEDLMSALKDGPLYKQPLDRHRLEDYEALKKEFL